MNEYEQTQAGKELSDSDEILDPDDMTAHDAGAQTQVEREEGTLMHALTLYRSGDHWVYDDPRFGRVAEPLILGASELLDQIIVFDLGTHTRNPVNVIFSGRPFPKAHMGKLMNEEDGGSWYSMEGKEAWLCPALLDYFDTAPPELFVKVVGFGTVDIPSDDAYPTDDPKHPEFHSTHSDLWDLRERG